MSVTPNVTVNAVTPLTLTPAVARQQDAAAYLGLTTLTLKNMRRLGEGPAYIRRGPVVLYRIVDLDTWLESQIVDPATGKGVA